MALSNLVEWNRKQESAPTAACGTACGAGDAPKAQASCGSACGAGDKPEEKPEEKPAACGSACGASDR